MDSKTPVICPRCGTSLDDSGVDGLCACCLGALNFAVDTELPGNPPGQSARLLTPEEIASHFPQLEVLEILGRGGMGVVYKSRQKTLGRMVALKLLAPERAAVPQFAEHFAREAKALAALSHRSWKQRLGTGIQPGRQTTGHRQRRSNRARVGRDLTASEK